MPSRRPFRDLHVVVTAGPTREYLDDVRFLSNASTGRMGIELARAARRRGAQVTLLLGPTHLAPPKGVRVVHVVSTADLLDAAREASARADVVFFAAAPSDYRPRKRRRGKPAREDGELALELVPTQDVAATLGRKKGSRLHIGFALEVGKGEARARGKLARKHFDAIVQNTTSNFGPGGGAVHWLEADQAAAELDSSDKARLAREILARSAALYYAR